MVLRLAYILCRCWVSCQTTIFCPPELIVTHVEHKKLATAAVFCRLYDDQETRIKVLSKSLEDWTAGKWTNSFMYVEQNCVWHQTVNVQCLYRENRISSRCFGLLRWFCVSTQEQQGRSQVLIQRLQEDLEHSRVEATDTFDHAPIFWLVLSFPNSLPTTTCAKIKHIISRKMLFNKVWSCDMNHNDMCHDVRLQTFFEDVIVHHDCSLPLLCESSCRKARDSHSLCLQNSAGRTRTIKSQGGLELGTNIGHCIIENRWK